MYLEKEDISGTTHWDFGGGDADADADADALGKYIDYRPGLVLVVEVSYVCMYCTYEGKTCLMGLLLSPKIDHIFRETTEYLG